MYVTGAANSFSFVDLVTDGYQMPFCPPAGGKNGQIRDIFTRYLREHPEERHEEAIILLVLALSEAWPCR
jgi:hypothetical protein